MQQILWEGDTAYGHYQVVDATYDGRPARVLYSGEKQAAQSGVAKDDNPDLLFDYNQRLLELACNLLPKRILLIGGGVLTLPTALLKLLPHTSIDVVEIDQGLIELAQKFFDVPVNDRLAIFNTDGRTFLQEHRSRYDMIVIDAFTHTTIPRNVKTLQAFQAYYAHLQPRGVVAMNLISGYYGSGARVLQEVYAAAARTFDTVSLFLASRGYSLRLPQNFVLVAQNGQNLPIRKYVRHDAVKPPESTPALALEDD
jgi:spermidine synthase